MIEVEIAGQRIAYERAGQGESLVLLHGSVADSRTWRRQLDGLSNSFDVIAWDAPGCGLSEDPPDDWRMSEFAARLAEWLEAIGLRRAHVAGLSWGSTLALELYGSRPELVDSLVLVSADAGWAGSLPPATVAERLESMLRLTDAPPADAATAMLPQLITPAAPAGLVDEVASMISELHPAAIPTIARAIAEADLREVLPRIEVPTLIVHGELDERAPLEVAYGLHAQIGTARLAVIPAAGHFCNMEAPYEFNVLVRDFIWSLPPGEAEPEPAD